MGEQDAEDVAAGLRTSSGGKIRTGVYHADVGDEAKAGLHAAWREGKVQVVVATIAYVPSPLSLPSYSTWVARRMRVLIL